MTSGTLAEILSGAPVEVVVDVEHLPNCEPGLANMLGVALGWPGSSIYVSLNHWEGTPSDQLVPQVLPDVVGILKDFLRSRELVGWNIEHDREWIDAAFQIESHWTIDGRILWYLTDREQKERGYSLKRAQVALLGWSESNDVALQAAVGAAGGSLDRGQHYLAPKDVLEHYAVLDARSTVLLVERLRHSDDDSGLRSAHDSNRDYARFLARATRRGVVVDERQLVVAKRFYEKAVQSATQRIREVCAEPIATLEAGFLAKRLQGYKSDAGKSAFLAAPGRHPRFNPNSPPQKAMLLYDIIGLPVTERTKKTGRPKTDKNTIASYAHPSAQAFAEFSKNEKLRQFASQFLRTSVNGVIHFPHDTCATVSERLGKDDDGGYASYDLNMPFASEPIMRAFKVRPGFVGVHMDLVSIEPCLLAGFSGDETMLKVYRDELGDIYLDLCLDLFPLEEADTYDEAISATIRKFHREYDTNAKPNTEQKEMFAKIRKIAKIIQLAVGYTGTKYTVSKSLTQAGFPTPLWKAGVLVDRYWAKFRKVERLAAQLKAIASKRGYINGLFGRRLYIPSHQVKDALNRFGQHGGHAILRDIVFNLDRRAKEVGMYPLLPDIHDSTSWEVPEERCADGIKLFEDAIRDVNTRLALPVAVRGEIRTFNTFYGLKSKE